MHLPSTPRAVAVELRERHLLYVRACSMCSGFVWGCCPTLSLFSGWPGGKSVFALLHSSLQTAAGGWLYVRPFPAASCPQVLRSYSSWHLSWNQKQATAKWAGRPGGTGWSLWAATCLGDRADQTISSLIDWRSSPMLRVLISLLFLTLGRILWPSVYFRETITHSASARRFCMSHRSTV